MLWAVFTAFLACAAYLRRLGWQDDLARSITTDAQAAAEHGAQVYVGNGGGWVGPSQGYVWLWQGPAIYLLERERDYPELARTLLLLEARRSYDAVYLYPYCLNWDLRQALITRCGEAYPADPEVAWAAGRLLLTCGEFEQSAQWQKRALDLGVDAKSLGVKEEHIVGRFVTTLVLLDRAGDAEAFLAGRAKAQPSSADAQYAYLDFLCKSDRYDMVRKLAKEAAARFPQDKRFMDLRLRAAKWSGRIDEYRELVRASLPPGAGQAEVYRAAPWLALYDRSPLADKLLSWPSEEAFRAYADVYAITRRHELLKRLEIQRDEEQRAYLAMQKAYVEYTEEVTKAWEKGTREYGDLGNAKFDHDLMELHSSLLTALDAQVPRALVLSGDARAAPDASASQDYWNPFSDLLRVAGGERAVERGYTELASTGTLPGVVRSTAFDNAVKTGGRKRADVLAEIRKAITPYRDTYYDCSNGTLSWPVMAQSPKESSARK